MNTIDLFIAIDRIHENIVRILFLIPILNDIMSVID